MAKKSKHFFEIGMLKLVLMITKNLPQSWILGFGRLIGFLAYHFRVRRSVVMKNLEIAFGDELSLKERKKICKQSYLNTGETIFEIILMFHIPKDKIDRHIQFEGLEYIKEASAKGRGVVICTGHFCNWEILPTGLSAIFEPIYGYIGKQGNPIFDRYFNQNRQKFGLITIPKSKQAVPQMMKALRENRVIGLIGDLNVPETDLFVDFFGEKAATGTGTAFLPLAMKSPILFSWGLRVGPFQHKCTIQRVLFKPTGDMRKDIEILSNILFKRLENVVKRYPEHYWWVHKRWKTRPPGDNRNLYKK